MFEGIEIIQGIVERGLIFSLVVAGIYLTSRIINFDDLTVEGSFGIGGALIAQCLTLGIPVLLSLPIVIFAGGLTGLVTGLLHTKLKLNNLISGIVTTTALFSITLKVAGSNLVLANVATIFSWVPVSLTSYKFLLIFLPIIMAIFFMIKRLLKTEIGFLLFAVGDNPQMLTNLGKKISTYKIIALMISNALAALSGALFVQYVGYFSIWASVGILIIGLAGLILGQALSKGFGFGLIFGAIMYQAIIAMTFELQIDQDWSKLITALLIVILIIAQNYFKKNEGK